MIGLRSNVCTKLLQDIHTASLAPIKLTHYDKLCPKVQEKKLTATLDRYLIQQKTRIKEQ